jgi:hypothetical protein
MDHFLTSDLWPLTSLFCVAPSQNVGPLGRKPMFRCPLRTNPEDFQYHANLQAVLPADSHVGAKKRAPNLTNLANLAILK